MFQQDFIRRAIEALGSALARVVGLRGAEEHEAALAEVEAAKAALPLVPGAIDQLSVAALRAHWDDSEMVVRVAQLYRHEAELAFLLGDRERAVRCARRAESLLK